MSHIDTRHTTHDTRIMNHVLCVHPFVVYRVSFVDLNPPGFQEQIKYTREGTYATR